MTWGRFETPGKSSSSPRMLAASRHRSSVEDAACRESQKKLVQQADRATSPFAGALCSDDLGRASSDKVLPAGPT